MCKSTCGTSVQTLTYILVDRGMGNAQAGTGADAAENSNALMQRFWDSALALEPADHDDDSVR